MWARDRGIQLDHQVNLVGGESSLEIRFYADIKSIFYQMGIPALLLPMPIGSEMNASAIDRKG